MRQHHHQEVTLRTPWERETTFPRLGYLYELIEGEAPEVPALLHFDDEVGIRIEVPFTKGSQDTAGRWFGRESTGSPERLLFQDHELNLQMFGV